MPRQQNPDMPVVRTVACGRCDEKTLCVFFGKKSPYRQVRGKEVLGKEALCWPCLRLVSEVFKQHLWEHPAEAPGPAEDASVVSIDLLEKKPGKLTILAGSHRFRVVLESRGTARAKLHKEDGSLVFGELRIGSSGEPQFFADAR